MKHYDSYKDSGIEWIGEIPSHWEVKPIKYLFYYTKGSQGQLLTSSYVQDNPGDYPVYSGQTENNGVLGYYKNYEFDFFNSVIFTTTVGAKFMTTKCLKDKFSLSQNCLIMIPKNDNVISTYHYYFLTIDWKYRRELVPVIIQPSLRMEDIDQFNTLLPPLSEQEQIVSYLDDKTTKIDELIQKKLRKIDLLKEYRTSLINTVVTKGLNPDVPMKDSGIEWIGEIPSHWEVSKFKYHSEIITGNTPSKTEDERYYTTKEKGFPWIKPSSLDRGFDYVYESEEYLTDLGKSYTRVIPIDSIMVCSIGNTLGKYGISGMELSTNQQINSVICDGLTLIPRYCLFFINVLTVDLIKWTNYVTLPIFTKSDFENTEVIVPPISEQEHIVSYLDEKTSQIDKTIDIEKKKIELLKEYRQSLISNVVTGKIKVIE
jgi:type I restriction enzyme S subunit